MSVLLTHSDYDHTGALGLFKNASIYLPTEEEQMINGTTNRNFMMSNHLNYPYTPVSNGEDFVIGHTKIRSMLTPGHTAGSTSYIIDGEYLFVGDTMSLQDERAEIFNDFYNMDSEKQKESIRELSKLAGVTYLFTHHYGYTAETDKVFEEWK